MFPRIGMALVILPLIYITSASVLNSACNTTNSPTQDKREIRLLVIILQAFQVPVCGEGSDSTERGSCTSGRDIECRNKAGRFHATLTSGRAGRAYSASFVG